MTHSIPMPPPGFDSLSVAEQIEYLQSLWERIAADPSRVPVPEWHRKTLRDRLDALEADRDTARPWGEVREQIEKKLDGDRRNA